MELLRRLASRFLAYTVTIITVLMLVFGADAPLAFAQPRTLSVKGGGPALPVAITINLPEQVNSTYQNVYTQLTRAGLVAFFNALQLFFGQLAYDAATYIATGGKGQKSVFYDKNFGDYLLNVGGAAVGEFVGNLSDSTFFKNIGLNLCRPSNPGIMLRLQLSLGEIGQQAFPQPPGLGVTGRFDSRPRPKCDFQEIVNNYSTLYETMSNGDILQSVSTSFDSSLSELGSITGIYNRFLGEVNRQVESASQQRTEGRGFRSIENLVSGNIRTPSAVVEEATSNAVDRYPNERQSVVIGAMLSDAFEQGPIQLASYTASIFLNTLASKFLKRIFEGGLGVTYTSTIFQNTGPDSIAVYGKTDARSANIDLKNPPIQRASSYDVISDMIACPAGQRGLWNCVLDQSFAQAIQTKGDQGGISIREALERKFLHSEWRLIPITQTRENQDSLCYTYGYCSANLQKLRAMRIIPVGFEFAANSQANADRCAGSQGCVTLGEVVSQFNACNDDGLSDETHPWCHLIDPNWILTSFPQQCAQTGYSDTLISEKLGLRKEECSDVQTCLKRNDKGECIGGYGYCLAEKTVYRFKGDECPAAAASCRTYVNSVGQKVSYLRNTVDRGQCSADNSGCLWYATQRNFADGRLDVWDAGTSTGEKIYFDQTLQGCDEANEGCTQLRVVTPGQSALNLVINGSFEHAEGASSPNLEGWKTNGVRDPVSMVDQTTSTAIFGTRSLKLRSPFSVSQKVALSPGRNYTFSGYVRVGSRDDGVSNLFVNLRPLDARNASLPVEALNRAYHSSSCTIDASGGANIGLTVDRTTLSMDWQRFECNFVSASGTAMGDFTVQGYNVAVDGVQLEEGEYATPFVDGLNTGLPVVHMKLPPQGLTCDARDVNRPQTGQSDFSACNKFALSCNQVDAGCQAYRDADLDGGEVPAIVSQNDLCPASCVGYAEFRKNPSAFDLVQDADSRFNDPEEATTTYFIPRTAGQCTQADVGCEEFTRVNETGSADGQLEYYSYLRACEKPDENTETFFTWEGADTTGYQLRTWSLKRGAAGLGPKSLAKLQPDQLSFKEPATCNEASWRTAADPDCRQFYDARGTIFYRYFSQTVISSNACVALRMNKSDRADCEKTGGSFNTRGECIYQALPTESRVCRAQVAGCRMFLGTGAGNTQTVMSQNFRESFTNDFPTDGLSLSTSSEALLVGDASLRVGPNPPARTTAVARGRFDSDDLAFYRVSFWAKAPAVSTSLTLSTSGQGSSDVVIGSVQLSPDWQRFTVGLFEGAAGVSSTNIIWSAPMPQGGTYGFYLDEVSVTRVQDLIYARNNTWNTPAECDKGIDGAYEAQAMLGCRRYQNRKNETVTARRFTRLCREEAIGCTAFVDTRNSEAVGVQTFVRADGVGIPDAAVATTTRPADRYVYLIDDPAKRCDAANASCRAFGRPRFMPDRQTLDPAHPFETMYFKDDITKYEAGLCKPSELFCSEFLYGNNKDYFKDPDTHICEYREAHTAQSESIPGITAGSQIPAGWYIVGGDQPCYPNILESDNFGLARSGDTTYKGWVGLCQEQYSECTELRDVNDHSDPVHRSGKPYYFVRNEQLDTSSCNGNIDLSKGCVLFRDMSDGFLKYNVKASYARYQQSFTPSPPVNCRETPDDIHCAQVGKCVGTIRMFNRTNTRQLRSSLPGDPAGTRRDFDIINEIQTSSQEWTGASCTVDSECQVDPVWSGDDLPFLVLNDSGFSVVSTTRSRVTRYDTRCDVRDAEDSNDSNLIVKVNVDRDCAQWLGCKSAETVRDPATNQYKDLCTDLALCDKASGQAGDRFCGNYVNRQSTSTEPILSQGAFFNIGLYTKRSVGLGETDYSGYALPGAFQVLDLKSTRVANDGAKTVPDAAYRFSQDYRLAAAIPMPAAVPSGLGYRHVRRAQVNEAEMLDGTPLASRFPGLFLCRHIGTGRIGYYLENERGSARDFTCYIPVRGENDTFDFQNVVEKFTLADPASDPLLSLAYPSAECRSYPEQESPFPASFTTSWDLSKNPPKPSGRRQGFSSVNTCEFGEDCACSYKKADFDNALVKYYNVYSPAVPPGICDGGPRSGQTCVPSTIFKANGNRTTNDTTPTPIVPSGAGATVSSPRQQAIEESNAGLTCGPPEAGGRCLPFKSVSIVRGTFGNCLERDMSRIIGNDQNQHPCLTWNPNPLLFGDKDPYHFDPQAGYLPPQNSGQYYCTSDARAPRTMELSAAAFNNDGGTYVGLMKKLDYDDSYVSDAHGPAISGNENGAAIDGVDPDGGSIGSQCEDTDDDQEGEDGVNETDSLALRLVNTGRSRAHSYTETFYRLNPNAIANNLYGVQSSQTSQANAAIVENNFSYISISPIRSPNGTARLGCGYNEGWVDGVAVDDYDELDQVKAGDTKWHDAFGADFKPILTRGTEEVMTTKDDGGTEVGLMLRNCVPLPGANPSDDCFFKTWETDYRAQNKAMFNAVTRAATATRATEDGGISFETIRRSPKYDVCDSDKPYFGIRAVFQTPANPTYQGQPVAYFTDSDRTTVKRRVSEVKGPWKLVGFWVTSCGGRSADELIIYMNVTLNFGDICRELAEVVSRDSHQDAAFTDRVWKNGNFVIPGLGIQYSARYSPFSSALNTGPAGQQPLFQTGQEVTGYSPLNPPTFIASGLKTYYEKNQDPKDKYAYLSNIFARIYRVYRFYDREVGTGDTACLAGPNRGTVCTPYSTQTVGSDGSISYSTPGGGSVARGVAPECSLNGMCDVNRYAAADVSQSNTQYCNSLSGINAGVHCPTNPEMCHIGPIQGETVRLLPCVTQADWRPTGDGTGRWEHLTAPGVWGATTTQENAADAGAFRCPNWANSMRREGISLYGDLDGGALGHKCSVPTDQGSGLVAIGSRECPERILDGAATGPLAPGGTNRMIAQCLEADGVTRADGAIGRCRVRIPSLNIASLPNHKSFSLPAFNIETTNEAYPSCHHDSDCSFTQMNYWYNVPRSPAGIEGSYFSTRSYRFVSYDGNSAHNCNDISNIGCKRYTVYSGNQGRWLTGYPGPGPRGGEDHGEGTHEYTVAQAELERFPQAERITNVTFDDIEGADVGMAIGACVTASAAQGNLGICTGGRYDGQVCDFPDRGTPGRTCIVSNTEQGRTEERTANVCGRVMESPGVNASECRVTPGSGEASQRNYSAGSNLNNDNNTCTHEDGYVPKSTLCPDPRDEFCGLVAYNIKAGEASFGRTSIAPLPTDVTQGLYTPSYLARQVGIPPRDTDETYASYYKPHPPMIAAPNLRNCASPGQCEILGVNKMTFNGQTEGNLNVASTQNKATISFYAWAAHEQMPLRSLYIDWGDGSIQKLPDARLLNHKPYCGVLKECVNPTNLDLSTASGLTCNTDSDCPAGAGVCRPVGTCKDKPNIRCSNDAQCRTEGGTDSCQFRTMFGNSPEACESNYFQFSHLYSCQSASLPVCRTTLGRSTARPPASITPNHCFLGSWEGFAAEVMGGESARPTCTAGTGGLSECNAWLASHGLSTNDDSGRTNATNAGVQCVGSPPAPSTTFTRRCERDPARVCDTNAQCAVGDRCVDGLAPPSDLVSQTGGCWDDQAQNCRFTPRIMLQDNWGWCTGECRNQSDGGGGLQDNLSQSSSAAPSALHPYGGCYSGQAQGSAQSVRANASADVFIKECSIEAPPGGSVPSRIRPWIVYPGSINLKGR